MARPPISDKAESEATRGPYHRGKRQQDDPSRGLGWQTLGKCAKQSEGLRERCQKRKRQSELEACSVSRPKLSACAPALRRSHAPCDAEVRNSAHRNKQHQCDKDNVERYPVQNCHTEHRTMAAFLCHINVQISTRVYSHHDKLSSHVRSTLARVHVRLSRRRGSCRGVPRRSRRSCHPALSARSRPAGRG